VVVPAVVVEGTGAAARGLPPLAAVYHFNEVPVAVSAEAVIPTQYATGVVTTGAAGLGLIMIVTESRGLSQPAAEVWLT
jgi:hypothetical protein